MPIVGECMVPIEYTVRGAEPLGHALEIIGSKQVEHLPVVDEAGRVQAIATDYVLRRYSRRGIHELPVGQVAQRLPDPPLQSADALFVLGRQILEEREATVVVDERRRGVGLFAEAQALKLAKSVLPGDTSVRDLAQYRDAPCVRGDRTCGEVLRTLFDRNERHVLVLRRGRLAGAISHRELMGRDERPVAEVLPHLIRTLAEDVELDDAINRLLAVPSGCLAVVDDRGALRGLLTRRHVIDALGRELLRKSQLGAVLRVARPGPSSRT